MTVPDPTAPTAEDVIAAATGQAIREHQPTTGMAVASGVTCRCRYWSGTEDPGRTRPVGYQGLQWHQATQAAAAVVAAIRGMSPETLAELRPDLTIERWRSADKPPHRWHRLVGPWLET